MSRKSLSVGRLSALAGYRLRRVAGAFAIDYREIMEGTGLRQVLLGVMAVIEANPGANQGAVGTLLGIKRANMVPVINELVDMGLIKRIVAPGDRRAFSLSLTQAGQARLAECFERIARHEARMLSPLSLGEQRILLELLSRIELQAG